MENARSIAKRALDKVEEARATQAFGGQAGPLDGVAGKVTVTDTRITATSSVVANIVDNTNTDLTTVGLKCVPAAGSVDIFAVAAGGAAVAADATAKIAWMAFKS